MRKKPRFVFTINIHLKEKLSKIAQKQGCSQAEVLKIALVKYLEAER